MTHWWQRGIVYQIYPRSFQDSNGDGVGDLPGIIRRLDYLQMLGVDALWISPFYPSPMADFGYDVSDYRDVHPLFGTLEDADRLIAAAHQRGLKIILDFVPNHTSHLHPWFRESRSSRDNPKRDWYIWRDPAPDGGPPNNWLSRFDGKSAWEWDETTGQYYMHTFLKEQPELNWRHPELREAMLDHLRFWFDRGVDGFRVDVSYRVMKDPEFRDNPPNPQWREGMDPSKRLLETYTKDTPEIHIFNRWLREVADEYDDRVLVGEINLPIPALIRHYGDGDEFHLPFNFRLIDTPWEKEAVADVIRRYEAALPAGAWPNWVLGNHDQHRFASRAGAAQARVGMMALLTLRGTPTIYYGEELGMEDVEIPPERVQDPWEKYVPGLGLGRDPERTPMQWSPAPHAGFTDPGAQPWLPLSDDFRQINVAVQQADPHSMLTLTRRLTDLRRRSRALSVGSYAEVEAPGALLAYVREGEGEKMLVVLNFGDEEIAWTPPEGLDTGLLLLSTRLDGPRRLDGTMQIQPNEGLVLRINVTR